MKRENRRLVGVAHGYSVTVWGGVSYMLPWHQNKEEIVGLLQERLREGKIKCQGGNHTVASVR